MIHSDSIISIVSPELGFQGSNMRPLDITTSRSITAHTGRYYGPYSEYVTHPGLPSGLVFPK